MRRSGIAAASLLIATGTFGAYTYFRSDQPSGLAANEAVVTRVVDGDTIVVRINGKSETIRFIGIDTPETVKPGAPVGCFGPEASNYTKSLLHKGDVVELMRDVEARDQCERLLAYVYRASDELFVNMDLVVNGMAIAKKFPPNTAFASQFEAAAAVAERNNTGLWGACPSPSE